MNIQAKLLCAIAVSGFAAFALSSPAQALTAQECSAKYQAAKTAGHARRARSGTTSARPNAAPTPRPPRPRCSCGGRARTGREGSQEGSRAGRCCPALPAGPAVYPNAVDPKYAKETAGKARMHTCVDQYNANKASNGNGGLKWIQKGGGYYSECTKKLKGAA